MCYWPNDLFSHTLQILHTFLIPASWLPEIFSWFHLGTKMILLILSDKYKNIVVMSEKD